MLDILLEKTIEAIKRDITHILLEGASRKLSPTSARDLVNYYKVLVDVQRQQTKSDEALAKLSDEELRSQVKALLDGAGEGTDQAQ